MSWFRKVGNESNHHTYIHTGAYSDAEGSKEQSPSGGNVGQWEVTFVHRLGGLEKNRKKTVKNPCCNKLKGNILNEKSLFKKLCI